MGKRYYCDYCNRSFIDDLDARKKHLNGTHHIRTRKLHYKQYKDMKTIVSEELTKEECRRFRTTGECQFGENCNNSHYLKSELDQMKQQVDEEEKLKQSHLEISEATVEQWLEAKLTKDQPSLNPIPLPLQQLYSIADLPPSLQLPSEQNLTDIELSEWG